MSRQQKSQVLLRSLGASIAKRRVELGLSQEELAGKAGVHRTYVSDVERGVRNISILTLERIAGALDIPLGALFALLMPPAVAPEKDGQPARRKVAQ